jgi:hypothetical protein
VCVCVCETIISFSQRNKNHTTEDAAAVRYSQMLKRERNERTSIVHEEFAKRRRQSGFEPPIKRQQQREDVLNDEGLFIIQPQLHTVGDVMPGVLLFVKYLLNIFFYISASRRDPTEALN